LSKLQLHTKILLGLVAGMILGVLANRLGFSGFVVGYIKPLGSIFIKLISMVVVPLVFASLLVGTASLNDIRKLRRIGTKTFLYYLCTTAIAVTIGQQLIIVLTATLASVGTAGAPGAGIITLAIVLKSIGAPLEGIAIIWGAERILDMCRSVVNVTGDASCAVVVAASEDR